MIEDHIKKYIDLPALELEIGIYYVLYSWFYTKVPTSPYLRYIADTGKGKSRILDGISDLCFYPIRASGASSASGIMRFHEKWRGTLVIDEGDLKGGADDPLIKFLNTGFEQGKYLILSDKNDPNKQQIFDPFGPKVIAMREPFKDNATEGRCISFSPYETSRQDIPPELSQEYHNAVEKIRAHIARFVLHNWNNVKGDGLIDINDLDVERRLLQMSRPLSIVLQIFPEGKERFINYVRKRQKENRKTRSESWEGSLFNHALLLAQDGEEGKIPEAIAPKMLAEVFKGTSSKAVTSSLQSIGFEIEIDHIKVRTPEGILKRKTVRKLVIPNEKKWQEITWRYYSPDDEEHQEKIIELACPDVLKGRKYGFVEQIGTLGTLGTDREHSPPLVWSASGTLGTDTLDTQQNFNNKVSHDTPLCSLSVPTVPRVPISYAGMTRKQLTEILQQYHPGQPPDPEAFRAAWAAAEGSTP
jgi:hypothetical protein